MASTLAEGEQDEEAKRFLVLQLLEKTREVMGQGKRGRQFIAILLFTSWMEENLSLRA